METQQEIARYAAGFLLLAIGGSIAAAMLGVRTVWIAFGLLLLAIVAALTLIRLLPRPTAQHANVAAPQSSDTATPSSDTATPSSDTATPSSDTATRSSHTATPSSDTAAPSSDSAAPTPSDTEQQ